MIVETATGDVGVTVGEVDEVLTVAGDQLEPLPAVAGSGLDAIVKVGERLVILLDPGTLLADAQDDITLAAAQ